MAITKTIGTYPDNISKEVEQMDPFVISESGNCSPGIQTKLGIAREW